MDNKKAIGGLWLQTSQKGSKYYSGTINGQKIIMFKNSYKQEGDNQPDYRIYERTAPQQQQQQQTEINPESFVVTPDDELPF